MKRFGVMLDMSRNAVMKPDQVKNFAKIIKAMGYNMLQLYTEDTYEVENEPYFGYLRGRYSAAELVEIVQYCESIGVEVIPNVQTLAHLNQIFLWERYQVINDTADILLTENERTYELIENMFKSLRKCFTSEYIHIGMDEAHMLGLGKYLAQHGFKNRFEILSTHLKRVIELAKKYGFKPIMWSDMFFRLAHGGDYYPEKPNITDDVIALTPEDVGLVYWDYYHPDKSTYDKLFAAHKQFKNEIWFAGGAWSWTGFTPGNERTINIQVPAMESAREQGIENIFITMWGDNGGECSYYSLLPALYTLRRAYDGVTDGAVIKAEFAEITGENYDEMLALDLPNYVAGNRCSVGNVSKNMLYNDPFFGMLDSEVKAGAPAEFAAHSATLSGYAKNSKHYGYLFESAAALCDLLSVKYDLGVRTRAAYQAGDKAALRAVMGDYGVAIAKTEAFYSKFSALWYTENKPHGFDVQDIRIGGLLQRLKACRERLNAYLGGVLTELPELEEKILTWDGGPRTGEGAPHLMEWRKNASVNAI